MATKASELSFGYGGLQYPLTTVTLAVKDLEKTMEMYWRAFGWSGWKVFDYCPPAHHNTELHGKPVKYTLKSAQVMVGSLNFELVQPLEGPSLWKEFIAERGEGLASIAVMFKTAAEAETVKREFAQHGIHVTMRGDIGDRIEYYYLDTSERFGCVIGCASGRATDFLEPSYFYPTADAPPTNRSEGLDYRITAVSVVVREVDSRVRAFREALGWGPWMIFECDGDVLNHDCEIDGHPTDYFNTRWAEMRFGELNFTLAQPRGGDNHEQRVIDQKGEGIGSIAVMFKTRAESRKVIEQFATMGLGITAKGHIGDHIEWYNLDTEPDFKCTIESGSGHAPDFTAPTAVWTL